MKKTILFVGVCFASTSFSQTIEDFKDVTLVSTYADNDGRRFNLCIDSKKVIKIKLNNKPTVCDYTKPDREDRSARYDISGNKITIAGEQEPLTFKIIDKNLLILTIGKVKFYMFKQPN